MLPVGEGRRMAVRHGTAGRPGTAGATWTSGMEVVASSKDGRVTGAREWAGVGMTMGGLRMRTEWDVFAARERHRMR